MSRRGTDDRWVYTMSLPIGNLGRMICDSIPTQTVLERPRDKPYTINYREPGEVSHAL